jgi:ABC-type transport system involved in multi-copper enzyme maturation permease subunit
MATLFQAEWRKVTGNRWLVGCLMGIFPLIAFGVVLLVFIFAVFSADVRSRFAETPSYWTEALLFFWTVPNSILGRVFILGFTAALFAGEYQWGTWKPLLMRRGRMALILTKFLTLSAVILLTFALTSLVWTLGLGLVQLVTGGGYPPALDAIPPLFWEKLALQITLALLSTLIMAGIAALAALVTRSIIASMVVGLFAALAEGFLAVPFILIYDVTGVRLFASLFRFSMTYNIDNLLNWATNRQVSPIFANIQVRDVPLFGDIAVDPPMAGNAPWVSLILLMLWVGLWVGLAVYAFRRQDLAL